MWLAMSENLLSLLSLVNQTGTDRESKQSAENMTRPSASQPQEGLIADTHLMADDRLLSCSSTHSVGEEWESSESQKKQKKTISLSTQTVFVHYILH